jgi:type VI protein secretion system component VasA
MTYEYDLIDRFLRNNLDDEAYAEYSAALDELTHAQPSEPASEADTLLRVIQRLNQNPYSLTKSECIQVVQEMRDAAQPSEPKAEPAEYPELRAIEKAEPARLTDAEILALEKLTPAMNDAADEWIYFARTIESKIRGDV